MRLELFGLSEYQEFFEKAKENGFYEKIEIYTELLVDKIYLKEENMWKHIWSQLRFDIEYVLFGDLLEEDDPRTEESKEFTDNLLKNILSSLNTNS